MTQIHPLLVLLAAAAAGAGLASLSSGPARSNPKGKRGSAWQRFVKKHRGSGKRLDELAREFKSVVPTKAEVYRAIEENLGEPLSETEKADVKRNAAKGTLVITGDLAATLDNAGIILTSRELEKHKGNFEPTGGRYVWFADE